MIYFDPQLLNQLAHTPAQQKMFFLMLQGTFLHLSKKESLKKKKNLIKTYCSSSYSASQEAPSLFISIRRIEVKILTATELICPLRGTPGERQTFDLGSHCCSVSTIVQVNQHIYWVLNIHVTSTRENSQVLP